MKRLAIALLALAMCQAPAVRAGDDAEAIARLLQRLRKGDGRVVPAIARHGADAVPGLIAVLKEGNADVQGLAMDALGRIGAPAKAAVPLLSEALTEGSNDTLAAQAAQTLGQIGPAALPELVKVLDKGDKGRAAMVARALGRIGPAAKEAAPALLKLLKAAKEPRAQAIFIDSLVAMGPGGQDAVPTLVALAKGETKSAAQVHVLVGLGKMGPAAKEAAPYLAEVMNDDKMPPHLRIHALQSLSQVAPASKDLAAMVPELLKSNVWPRPIVIEVLANAGPVTKEVRTILEGGLTSKDATTRVHAAQALGRSDPKDRAVVSVLIEALQDKDAQVRRLAATAIGVVMPADPAVGRLLGKAVNDPDPAVRAAATAALKKLEKN